jgi:serine protease AprX
MQPARRSPALLAFLSLALAFVFSAFAEGGDTVRDKLTGRLPEVVDRAGPDELIPVTIVLRDQLTGNSLRQRAAGIDDPRDRRRTLITALKQHARESQERLLVQLDAAEAGHRAQRIRPLWIGNVVAAELVPEEVRAVAARPEVDRVNWNREVDVFLDQPLSRERASSSSLLADLGLGSGGSAPLADETECGVELMRAPEVWDDLGITGAGAVIAVIDTGVCWYHSDIQNQIWVNPGEDLDGDGVVMDEDDENGIDDDGNGYVDDLIGYDIDNGDNDPNDDNSHGSHCAGTVAGDGTAGHQSGMAPDAKVMVLRVGTSFSDEADVWEAMQYAADNNAHSISMSLGWPHDQDPDRQTWRNNCENTIDLGTAMVIAAGNEGDGNEPDNVRTPGDVPRVITVGAVDCSDAAASFSSRGPVTWEDVPPWNDHPYPPGLIKPDVAAPGVSTRSHNKCEGYSNKSGTSMATPHVAGAVALMVSANPGLTHDDLKLLLEDTSVDLGEAGKDNTYGSGRVDAYEAVLHSASSDGRISIRESRVACDALLHLVVADADLKGTGTVDVEVTSDTETEPEIVTLTESSADSGVFKGEIPTDTGAPAADGKIQVSHEDVITATYIDEDDGEGGTNVPKTDTAVADCVAPHISDVDAVDIDNDSARIVWTTDESSTSVVRYGSVTPPDNEESDNWLVTDHSVPLTGLAECTIYKYEVESADAQGNAAIDDNGGQYYKFETYRDDPDLGLIPCHKGVVSLNDEDYTCDDMITATVTDIDLNTDPEVQEEVQLLMTSTSEPDGEWITARELDADNSRFRGEIQLDTGEPAGGDGLLAIAAGDLITVTYFDDDDGDGEPAKSTDTAKADCIAPYFSDIRVTDVTASRAVVRWSTDEPSTTRLDWGTSPSLGQVVESDALTSSHSVTLDGLDTCQRIHFRIGGADRHGDYREADADGEPFAFNLNEIGGLVFYDGFESLTGWDTPGEWEIGAPQGLGSGNQDPDQAYSGSAVLGLDLSGQGSHAGDYEPEVDEAALSPTLDTVGRTHLELIFRRKLGVRTGDHATIFTQTAGITTVWNSSSTVNDSGWTERRYDISGSADNQPALRIGFRLEADGSSQSFGWNVDELIVKDAREPDYAACANCAGAPTFGGLESVHDPDPCAPGGLELTWSEAPAWGTGGGGSYEVFRSTDPGFVPDSANRVASGLTGTSWTDADAPVDQQVWYVVRARNNESCGADGGLDDGNLLRVAGTETIEQPMPGSPGRSLTLRLVGEAHVRLAWDPASPAHHYVVRRSESADFSDPVDVGETQETFLEDENAANNAKTYFYKVYAANACGEETP